MAYPAGRAIEDGGKLLIRVSTLFPKAFQGSCLLNGGEVGADKVFGQAFLHIEADGVVDDAGRDGGPAQEADRLKAAVATAKTVALAIGGYSHSVNKADVGDAVGQLAELVRVVGEALVVVVVRVK